MDYQEEGGIGELVRKLETDYTRGNVTISEYVIFDMYDTINTIEAYLNSKYTEGQYDSLGNEKPFANIVVQASNIWFRATDIDRSHIRIKATKEKDVIDAFLATVHLQNWMTKANFGQVLNDWGRVLARYGSAVLKFVEKDGDLIVSVVPWNRLIVDPIDFDNNIKIEVLELTEAQLRKNKKYDQDMVEALTEAKVARETINRRRKDNKSDYIKLYEVHGELPLSYITGKEKDEEEYVQQMHVISFVESKKRGEYQDFTLYKGLEKEDPYMITHLIKEDGRTLAIGAVEHMFQAQWMVNHNALLTKNQLELASKLLFQTADPNFVGKNVLNGVDTGDILVHTVGMPLTELNNRSHDIDALQSNGAFWKNLGSEIVGISEAMLGEAAKSGTAWRQTEALLQESYSLFELMTENKGIDLEKILRTRIIPFLKRRHMNTNEEVSATLNAYDLKKIDARFIKNFSAKEATRLMIDEWIQGINPTPERQQLLTQAVQDGIKAGLRDLGNQRFFIPSDKVKNWKEQFKNLEWELEIDITGENKDYRSFLATYSTALQMVMNPMFEQNPRAQMIVDKLLMATGQFSPLELSSIEPASLPVQAPSVASPPAGGTAGGALPDVNELTNGGNQ